MIEYLPYRANSVDDFKELYDNNKYFKMKFFDIGAGLKAQIESGDISNAIIKDNRIEMINHDGICFITNCRNIFEINERIWQIMVSCGII